MVILKEFMKLASPQQFVILMQEFNHIRAKLPKDLDQEFWEEVKKINERKI